MNNLNLTQNTTRFIASTLIIAMGLIATGFDNAQAESLFRASANYQEQKQFTPHSLYTQPQPNYVGDIITIMVNETTSLTSDAELKVTRTQTINENGSGMFNTTLGFFMKKIPFFRSDKLVDALSAPSYDGINNANNLNSKAESTRSTNLNTMITCQVVQVLPNGHLMVQGRKLVEINKERENLFVTGIVNPYYLDRNNQIASSYVGNFQLIQGGKGVISRQQNDGLANKIYQFFN